MFSDNMPATLVSCTADRSAPTHLPCRLSGCPVASSPLRVEPGHSIKSVGSLQQPMAGNRLENSESIILDLEARNCLASSP
jgi:hypothetical protein